LKIGVLTMSAQAKKDSLLLLVVGPVLEQDVPFELMLTVFGSLGMK
jgi:hypothetical protein